MPRLRPNLVLIAVVLLALVYVTGRDLYVNRSLRFALRPDAVAVDYRRELTIPYGQITALSFFKVPPAMKGSFLQEIGRSRIGLFAVEGAGQVEMYSPDGKRPFLIIQALGKRYGLAPPKADRFYRDLLARLPERRPPTIGGVD